MLHLLQVRPNSACRGEKCKHCNKAVKVGHAVAWCNTDNFTKRRFVIHMSCMAALVSSSPMDIHVEAFEETKKKILETGSAWA